MSSGGEGERGAPLGLRRLIEPALIGGVVGGVLSGLPMVSGLNCCFCMLNHVGVAAGLWMFLRKNPGARVSYRDAVGAGAVSGAVAGVTAVITGWASKLLLDGLMSAIYRYFPRALRRALGTTVTGTAGIPLGILLFTVFGALGGYLVMQFFFEDRVEG